MRTVFCMTAGVLVAAALMTAALADYVNRYPESVVSRAAVMVARASGGATARTASQARPTHPIRPPAGTPESVQVAGVEPSENATQWARELAVIADLGRPLEWEIPAATEGIHLPPSSYLAEPDVSSPAQVIPDPRYDIELTGVRLIEQPVAVQAVALEVEPVETLPVPPVEVEDEECILPEAVPAPAEAEEIVVPPGTLPVEEWECIPPPRVDDGAGQQSVLPEYRRDGLYIGHVRVADCTLEIGIGAVCPVELIRYPVYGVDDDELETEGFTICPGVYVNWDDGLDIDIEIGDCGVLSKLFAAWGCSPKCFVLCGGVDVCPCELACKCEKNCKCEACGCKHCDAKPVVEVYTVQELTPAGTEDAERLIHIICSMVEPASWSCAGGEGAISYYPAGRCLVVKHHAHVHHEIVVLLDQLGVAVQEVQASQDCWYRERAARGSCPGATSCPRVDVTVDMVPIDLDGQVLPAIYDGPSSQAVEPIPPLPPDVSDCREHPEHHAYPGHGQLCPYHGCPYYGGHHYYHRHVERQRQMAEQPQDDEQARFDREIAIGQLAPLGSIQESDHLDNPVVGLTPADEPEPIPAPQEVEEDTDWRTEIATNQFAPPGFVNESDHLDNVVVGLTPEGALADEPESIPAPQEAPTGPITWIELVADDVSVYECLDEFFGECFELCEPELIPPPHEVDEDIEDAVLEVYPNVDTTEIRPGDVPDYEFRLVVPLLLSTSTPSFDELKRDDDRVLFSFWIGMFR